MPVHLAVTFFKHGETHNSPSSRNEQELHGDVVLGGILGRSGHIRISVNMGVAQ